MSVWLAGTDVMSRIYGSLTFIRNQCIAGNPRSLQLSMYRMLANDFPQFKWSYIEHPDADPVRDLCTALWRMNTATYNHKYREKERISAKNIQAMVDGAVAVDHIQLFKDIGFIEYQCSEYFNESKKLYKQLTNYEDRLGSLLLRQTPEYDAAKWG